MDDFSALLIRIAVLILSVVVHEVSHGLAAYALGDSTAKYMGRLTINPVRHLDFWGSLVVPLISWKFGGFLFGWAKPVPYNPYNLRDQKYGPAIVGFAGPASNLLLALVGALALRLLPLSLSLSGDVSAALALQRIGEVLSTIVITNIGLAVFNLVPIPPLDGSKLLFALLPYRYAYLQGILEQYGFVLLALFLLYGFHLILPLMDLLHYLMVGQRLL